MTISKTFNEIPVAGVRAYTHTHTHTRTYKHAHARTRANTNAHTYTQACTHTNGGDTEVCARTYTPMGLNASFTHTHTHTESYIRAIGLKKRTIWKDTVCFFKKDLKELTEIEYPQNILLLCILVQDGFFLSRYGWLHLSVDVPYNDGVALFEGEPNINGKSKLVSKRRKCAQV